MNTAVRIYRGYVRATSVTCMKGHARMHNDRVDCSLAHIWFSACVLCELVQSWSMDQLPTSDRFINVRKENKINTNKRKKTFSVLCVPTCFI